MRDAGSGTDEYGGCHHAVGNDNLFLRRGIQGRVTERQLSDRSAHDSLGGVDLNVVAQPEGVIEQDRKTSDQVAEGALSSKTEHDGADAGTSQQRTPHRA